MVQEHFVRLMHESRERRLARLSGLKDRRDAEAYVDEVRGKIRECFGLFPEKTPLNARITGTVQRSAYTIEKVIFESRPGFLVTANLYVPKGRPFPLPGVVGSCGHSVNGKASETYQGFSQGLATMGYVVLTFDPIGQGERMQYVDPSTWKPLKGTGTREHLYAGNQQFLVGEFFGSWRAWDGIRALDYLLSREEVDPRLVGITGNSGGGTMTTWLCALEERWTMAAPGCFVTEFRRNLENELPADTEQCPPKALALDLEHEDFIAVMAPKPVILLAKERDFFDARGSEAAFERLRRLYALLGAEDNIAFSLGPTPHGYSRESREAMYRWFNRVTGVSDAKTEPALVIEKDETLWCTPHGQIAELAPTPIHSFTRVRSQALRKRRLDPSGEALRRTLLRVLRIPEPGPSPEFRILRPQRNRRYPLPHAVTYMVETEPGVHAIVYRLSAEPLWSRPPRDVRRAILYVSHLSSDEELRSEPLIRELVEGDKAAALFTCDVRGIGDSRPDTCDPNSFRDAYGSDYFYAIHSVMFDRPYVGRRTLDVWTVLEWLYAGGHAEVHLAAKGWGTVPAAFAAVLSRRVPRVTLKNALTSFSEVAEAADYNWPLALLPPDVLSHFDLPDCYRELERGELRIIEPWGANPAV
jgi:dienelactone hydrolase